LLRTPAACNCFDRALEHRGARVAHAVDAMAHAHDALPGGELARDPSTRAFGRADRIESAAWPRLASGASGAPRVRTVMALIDAMARAGRPKPNVDVALAAVCGALDLPIGMGPAIFAIGRRAGWIAHVLEQQCTGMLLRPRARFVGVDAGEPPGTAAR
jgi:hypothetical protein